MLGVTVHWTVVQAVNVQYYTVARLYGATVAIVMAVCAAEQIVVGADRIQGL